MPSPPGQSAALLMGCALRRLREEGERYFEPARIDFQPVPSVQGAGPRVLQVQVRNSARPCNVFIKSFLPADESPESLCLARERLRREYAALVQLHAMAARHPGLSVSRPIACFPEELCMVTEQVPGVKLRSLLHWRRPWQSPEMWTRKLLPVFGGLGTWVGVFQQCGAAGGRLSLGALQTYLETRLQTLQQRFPGLLGASERISILRQYERLSREVDAEDLAEVSVHADFCPDNVVVNGAEVTVLDFEMTRTGAKYSDVSHMYMHIDNLKVKPWIGRVIAQRFQDAMLQGYDPALKRSRPMFQLCLLINVVCHFARLATTKLSLRETLQHKYLWKNHWHWLTSLGRANS